MSVLTAADLELESVEMLPTRNTLTSWGGGHGHHGGFLFAPVDDSVDADQDADQDVDQTQNGGLLSGNFASGNSIAILGFGGDGYADSDNSQDQDADQDVDQDVRG